MSRWTEWWRRWRARRNRQIEEISPLTDQFYTTLEAELVKIEAGPAPRVPQALAEARALLERQEKSWADAYRIEQLLVHLYDDPTMDLELERRLEECRRVLGSTLTGWYQQQERERKLPAERRALLARLVNDLQWRYMVNEVKRGYSKAITRSSGWVFVFSLLLFLLWAVWPYLAAWQETRGEAAGAAGTRTATAGAATTGGTGAAGGASLAGDPVPAPGAGDAPRQAAEERVLLNWEGTHEKTWYLLLLAGFAGAWGASFSMLTGLKKRLDASHLNDLKLMRSLSMLISRPLIGLGAAFILYFFVVAGLLSGSLFPDFTESGQTIRNLALLVVWSFIAGFSEKLVPALLVRTGEAMSEPRAEAEAAVPARPPGPPPAPPPSGGGGDGGERPGAPAGGGGAASGEGVPAPPPAAG